MHTERILALADLIEKQPHTTTESPEGFTMDNWHHDCGTPACIAGWACHVSLGGNVVLNKDVNIELTARYFLGLDAEKADALFQPDLRSDFEKEDDFISATDAWGDITPEHAARTLRRLAKTGKVDWKADERREELRMGEL